MADEGTYVVVVDDYAKTSKGLNNLAELHKLPPGYSVGIWTDQIDVVGPILRATSNR